jgi:hypothetical protein
LRRPCSTLVPSPKRRRIGGATAQRLGGDGFGVTAEASGTAHLNVTEK